MYLPDNLKWSIYINCGYRFSSYQIQDVDSESEDSSDEEDIFGISYLPGQNDSWNSDGDAESGMIY
jgi:hypothetical protein